MHTTDTGNFTFHHNGDFSGDVHFDVKIGDSVYRASIPFADIKELFAEYLRYRMLTKLETLSTDELIDLLIEDEV